MPNSTESSIFDYDNINRYVKNTVLSMFALAGAGLAYGAGHEANAADIATTSIVQHQHEGARDQALVASGLIELSALAGFIHNSRK